MPPSKYSNDEFTQGLCELATSAFPKRCSTCGREYQTSEQFLRDTALLRNGIKAYSENDQSYLEIFRNCPCGSTLLEVYKDRRDTSVRGVKRRDQFRSLLEHLVKNGLPTDIARRELLKIVHGESSEILSRMNFSATQKPFKKP